MFLVLSASSRRFKGNFITGNGKVGTGRFPQRDFSAVINDSPSVDEEDCSRSRPPCRLISRTKWRRGEGQWGDCCCSLQKDARFRRKKMSEQFWSRRKLGPPPLWLKIFSRGRWRFLRRSFFFSSLLPPTDLVEEVAINSFLYQGLRRGKNELIEFPNFCRGKSIHFKFASIILYYSE